MGREAANVRNLVTWLATGVAIVAIDQAVKDLMRNILAAGPRELIPGVLRLLLVENRGAAFSLGEGASGLFAVVALGVTIASGIWVARDREMPLSLAVSLAFVCGGGIGNLIDRVAKASVTDFLATEFVSFPVFNVADIFITCGVVLTFLLWYAYDLRREAEAREAGDGR